VTSGDVSLPQAFWLLLPQKLTDVCS